MIVAVIALLYNPFHDYFYRAPERRALSATVSAFDFSQPPADSAIAVELLFQNLGNRAEIIRSINFVLPFDARGLLTGDYWYVPAGFRFAIDTDSGVGKCWPTDTLGVITNLYLGPGDVALKRLRQPVSKSQLLSFLRGNESRLGSDTQLIAVELTVADAGEGARMFIATVASVALDGAWRQHEWVKVDLSGPGVPANAKGPLPGPMRTVSGDVGQ